MVTQIEEPVRAKERLRSTLLTFLIADVRGYTQFTAEHGDEAAARLAGTFATIAKSTAAKRDGEVIELRGDEALAVFDSARQALRAALELQQRFTLEAAGDPLLPLHVRIGLDAGEAIPVEGGYRGGALNLAARLSSLAEAGEVLASGAVTHLAGKIDGVTYAERGHAQLKGFADSVMVMEVVKDQSSGVPNVAAIVDEIDTPTATQEFSLGGFLGALPTNDLVGRHQELNDILNTLDAVERGTGRLVVLAGEPGAGKTRLAQEVTLHLRNRGFLVAVGRCFEPERGVPYYPFLDALATIFRAVPRSVQREVPRRWPYAGALLPDQIGAPKAAVGSGMDEEQRVLRAVTGFLDAAAEFAPVALLLDDLQWADASSLKLLIHLARRTRTCRILLLGIYRDVEVGRRHPLEGTLRDLGREGLMERVAVRPLKEEGTAQLISATIGEGQVSAEFARFVHAWADGNPFFVQQVVRMLVERGDLIRKNGIWDRRQSEAIEVPEGVRSVIGQRVCRLSERAQEVLREASVLGETFRFDDLLVMTGRSEEVLEEALEEARTASLLGETDRDAYAFDHILTQQTLCAELSSRRRCKLHLAAAEALDQLPEHERRQRMAELAWHWYQGGDTKRGARYSLLLGAQAERVFAHSDAEAHFRTVLELGGTVDDGIQVEAREMLGHVLSAMARFDDALEVLNEAAAAYRALGDSEGEAQVVAEVGEVHFLRGTPEDGLARLQPLVARLEGSASPALPRLYAAQATLLFGMGRYQEQAVAAKEGAALARARGDQRTVVIAEGRLGYALLLVRHLEEAMALYQRIIPQYEASDVLPSLCSALTSAADVQAALGDVRAAGTYLTRALTVADRMGDQLPIAEVLQALGWNELIIGNWDHAYDYSVQADAILRALAIPRLSAAILTLQGTIRLYQGEGTEASRLLNEAEAMAEQGQDERAGRGVLHKLVIQDLMAGRAEAALTRLHLIVDERDLWNDAARNHLAELAEVHLNLGNHARAEEIAVEALKRHRAERDQFALVEMLLVYGMALAWTQRWEGAEAAWDEAASLAERMPYPYIQARVLLARGIAQMQRGYRDVARERMEDARAIFQRLGARAGIEKTEQALSKLL